MDNKFEQIISKLKKMFSADKKTGKVTITLQKDNNPDIEVTCPVKIKLSVFASLMELRAGLPPMDVKPIDFKGLGILLGAFAGLILIPIIFGFSFFSFLTGLCLLAFNIVLTKNYYFEFLQKKLSEGYDVNDEDKNVLTEAGVLPLPTEKKKNKVMLGILGAAFLFLLFSLIPNSGSNISKVKNGIFSDFDPTITVGQAFAYDQMLQGGKWKSYKYGGRNFVSYTVKLNENQIKKVAKEKNKRINYEIARHFSGNNIFVNQIFDLNKDEHWENIRNPIYKAFINASEDPAFKDFFDEDNYENYFDPWLLNFLDGIDPDNKENAINLIWRDVQYQKVGMSLYIPQYFINENEENYIQAIKKSVDNFKKEESNAREKHKIAVEKFRSKDINKLVTVSNFKITFVFVMDQLYKDNFYAVECLGEGDLVVNILDNKKISWHFSYENQDSILRQIYRPDERYWSFIGL